MNIIHIFNFVILSSSLLITGSSGQRRRTFVNRIKKDVLFLGNSYTYYNDMPDMVKKMAAAQGWDLNIRQYAQNDGELSFYLSSNVLDNYINQPYDIVIIQEQSTNPMKSIKWVQENTFPTARQVTERVRQYGDPRIIFYGTWGRPGPHESMPCDKENTQFCSYDGMQDRLTQTYTTMAYLNQPAEVAPAGEVYRYMKNVEDFKTWEGFYNVTDKSHPLLSGSYAIASTITATITGKKNLPKGPDAAWVPKNLKKEDANLINKVVNKVVFDPAWTFGGYWAFNSLSNPPCKDCIRYLNEED